MLARTFYQDSNYLKSKNLALYAITEGSDHCPADEAIHDAARAYAQLGRFDSANFFLSRLKQHNLSPEEKVKLLTTKTILFEKEGNFKEALVTYKEAADIADSIISSSHQQQLFLKEKCYDTQVLKTENIEIKHKKFDNNNRLFNFSDSTLHHIYCHLQEKTGSDKKHPSCPRGFSIRT